MRRFYIDSENRTIIVTLVPENGDLAFGAIIDPNSTNNIPMPTTLISLADCREATEMILVEKEPLEHVIGILDMITGGDIGRAILPESYFNELVSAHAILREELERAKQDARDLSEPQGDEDDISGGPESEPPFDTPRFIPGGDNRYND